MVMFATGCLMLAIAQLLAQPPAGPVVEDIFGRKLNEHGLILVDWEGQMANPAVRFLFQPPADAAFPVKAVLKAKEPRLYFDLPSGTGPAGPRKEFLFKDRAKAAA